MKNFVSLKRTIVFIIVFSLTISSFRIKTKAAAPIIFSAINLIFIVTDVLGCIKAEDKFNGCVVPLAANALSAIVPIKLVKKINKVANTSKPKIDELLNTLKIANTIDELRKSNNLAVSSYKILRSSIQGTGLEAHHLLEHRGEKLAKALGLDTNKMISVVLSHDVHTKITRRWMNALPRRSAEYGKNFRDLWKYRKAIDEVYYDLPELRKLAKYQLYASEGFWKKVGGFVILSNIPNATYNLSKILAFKDKHIKPFSPLSEFAINNYELINSINNFDLDLFEEKFNYLIGSQIDDKINETDSINNINSIGDLNINTKTLRTPNTGMPPNVHNSLYTIHEDNTNTLEENSSGSVHLSDVYDSLGIHEEYNNIHKNFIKNESNVIPETILQEEKNIPIYPNRDPVNSDTIPNIESGSNHANDGDGGYRPITENDESEENTSTLIIESENRDAASGRVEMP